MKCLNTSGRNDKIIRVIEVFLLILNPFIASIVATKRAFSRNKYSELLFFAIVIGIFASGINITKIPESDQLNYLYQFNQVEYAGFTKTLLYGGGGTLREPIYGIYVFLSYYILGGSAKLFFFITSFLALFFHYLAMINVGKKYNYPNYIIVAGILSLTFFTQFFSLTLHLVRQILATGIAFYAISLRLSNINKYKVYIPWMLVAIFTHSSSILVIFMSFLPKVNAEKFSYRNLFYLVVITIIFTQTFPLLSKTLLGGEETDNFASYALTRAQNSVGLSDNSTGQNMNQTHLDIITIPLLLICFYSYIKKRKDVSVLFINICIMMCLFVRFVSFSPLIQYRYFFYLYSFVLFILPITFAVGKQKSKVFCALISIFMVLRFFISYADSVYTYGDIMEILFYPLPVLFTIHPY